jgi:hypothetical protein
VSIPGFPAECAPLIEIMGRTRLSLTTTVQDMLVQAHRQADDPELVRQRIRYVLRLCEGMVRDLDLEDTTCPPRS